ncbi:MAG: class I tRNA ligase family protein, partial [bacterium]|nr:class I tRNA ligase family protein [bacterium]
MEWDDPATLDALRDALHAGDGELGVTLPSGHEARGPAERIVARLGCAEYGGSYFTFSDENNDMIWAFLKKCHEQGFIYHGNDVVPWCCRCGTGLSQMEVAEGRKRVSHTSVFVRFPLRDRPGEALLVWTTTPWTLTANVAAAVNPRSTYLRIRRGDWIYYLGKGNFERDRSGSSEEGDGSGVRLQSLPRILGPDVEILDELPGSELVGLEYDGPFDHLPAQKRPGGCLPDAPEQEDGKAAVECHRVIPWDEVSETEGTGIVHIAPGCGAEDHQLGREHGLAAIAPLSEAGEYVEGFGELSGRGVLTVADDVVADLKRRGLLVARERYPHVYPHCWRCKQELVFRLVDEWFIRMDWRDRIQRIVGDVRWVPPEGEACEQDWLKNMGDWMISKKRFWGLALPIWLCDDCREFTVVGSREELRERAVEGWDAFAGHSPHRPWVDAVKIRCPSCGALARRIPDVGNPWLDAGIVPFSTMHFQRHPEIWEKWFPADLVLECFPGQFRNWFYVLLAMSAMMDGRAPFKALLGHGLVRDARAQEMHKSLGNAIDFDRCADTLGAELVRYIFARQNPAHHVNFPDVDVAGDEQSDTELANTVRRRLLTLWNSYSFFITYA